jgi:hypothetical protein
MLMRIVGTAIGPAVAGMYMQANQSIIEGITRHFSSPESYILIFLQKGVIYAKHKIQRLISTSIKLNSTS